MPEPKIEGLREALHALLRTQKDHGSRNCWIQCRILNLTVPKDAIEKCRQAARFLRKRELAHMISFAILSEASYELLLDIVGPLWCAGQTEEEERERDVKFERLIQLLLHIAQSTDDICVDSETFRGALRVVGLVK